MNQTQIARQNPGPQADRHGWLRQHRQWIWVVLSLLIAFGLFRLWKDQIEDRVIPKRWGVVHANQIYRSGQLSESLIHRMLEKHEIEVIIDLTTHRVPDDPDQAAEMDAVRQLGIAHHRFPLQGDGKGDPRMYQESLLRLHDAISENRPVLVHCAAGAQRTGGLIAVWRLLVDGWDRDAIIDEMVAYDWRRRDKHNLLGWLDEHMVEFASALHRAGAIDAVPDPLPRLGRPISQSEP